jgi:hypothetical protein
MHRLHTALCKSIFFGLYIMIGSCRLLSAQYRKPLFIPLLEASKVITTTEVTRLLLAPSKGSPVVPSCNSPRRYTVKIKPHRHVAPVIFVDHFFDRSPGRFVNRPYEFGKTLPGQRPRPHEQARHSMQNFLPFSPLPRGRRSRGISFDFISPLPPGEVPPFRRG